MCRFPDSSDTRASDCQEETGRAIQYACLQELSMFYTDGEDCIEARSIFLEPNYQREVVWDEARAGLLITSILSKAIPVLGLVQLKLTIFGSGLFCSANHLQCQEDHRQSRGS